jgi:hypothetical protein
VDGTESEVEQGLREGSGEWRSVHVRTDDSLDGEAIGPLMRPFGRFLTDRKLAPLLRSISSFLVAVFIGRGPTMLQRPTLVHISQSPSSAITKLSLDEIDPSPQSSQRCKLLGGQATRMMPPNLFSRRSSFTAICK